MNPLHPVVTERRRVGFEGTVGWLGPAWTRYIYIYIHIYIKEYTYLSQNAICPPRRVYTKPEKEFDDLSQDLLWCVNNLRDTFRFGYRRIGPPSPQVADMSFFFKLCFREIRGNYVPDSRISRESGT